jgi:hypothetical protein
VRRDILRWEDTDYMREIMNKMIKYRIEDKVAFRNNDNYERKGHKSSKNNNNSSISNTGGNVGSGSNGG